MNILILGGGITGLSAAWFYKKKYPEAKITLLEKENRLGGWIRTSFDGGFLFEKGPRTFQMGRSEHLLKLISDLKLKIIPSDRAAAKRFILYQGKLRSMGFFLPRFIPTILKELFVKPSLKGDESIYDFAARRFSPKMAETLFDPLTLGIYAGDIHKLSVRTCFPAFYHWERQKGSVVKGLLSSPKKAKGLFTIKEGMQKLIDELEKQLDIEIVFNCPIDSIGETQVFAGGKTWEADKIINALPPALPKKSVWVVNLAFEGDVLTKKGFGYLVPSQEKQSLLGMIFDSAIFPQQNSRTETRLTAMIREEEEDPLQAALAALSAHLHIEVKPIYTSSLLAKEAIAQFEVDCNYPHGISVDACIKRFAVPLGV